MMTRLLCLVLIIFNTSVVAQDTLAVVDQPNGAGYGQVLFSGDTMLIRLVNDPMKTAYRGSVASWHTQNQKIGDVDLSAIKSNLIVRIKRYASFTYYYGVDEQGKNTRMTVYGSNDNAPAVQLIKHTIEGTPVAGIDRGETFILATWDNNASVVNLSEFKKANLVATKNVRIPLDLHRVDGSDIVFLGPGSSEALGVISARVKFFLNDNTFGAVVDDQFEGYLADISTFKTTAFRKDLATGKEDVDVFFTKEEYAFKSYLKDTLLYRLTSGRAGSSVTIHDLNANKVVRKIAIDELPDLDGYDRLPAINKVFKKNLGTFNGIRATKSNDLAMAVDDCEGKHILSIGFRVMVRPENSPTRIPLVFPTPVGFLYMSIPLNDANAALKEHPDHLRYLYLEGSPTEDFVRTSHGEESDFVKIAIDEFESVALAEKNFDFVAHYPGPNFWVGMYSAPKSTKYYIVKFDVKK